MQNQETNYSRRSIGCGGYGFAKHAHTCAPRWWRSGKRCNCGLSLVRALTVLASASASVSASDSDSDSDSDSVCVGEEARLRAQATQIAPATNSGHTLIVGGPLAGRHAAARALAEQGDLGDQGQGFGWGYLPGANLQGIRPGQSVPVPGNSYRRLWQLNGDPTQNCIRLCSVPAGTRALQGIESWLWLQELHHGSQPKRVSVRLR